MAKSKKKNLKEKDQEPRPDWLTPEQDALMWLLTALDVHSTAQMAVIFGLKTRKQQTEMWNWICGHKRDAMPDTEAIVEKLLSIRRAAEK